MSVERLITQYSAEANSPKPHKEGAVFDCAWPKCLILEILTHGVTILIIYIYALGKLGDTLNTVQREGSK